MNKLSLSQYSPSESISYLELIEFSYSNFRNESSLSEFVNRLGKSRVTNVSNTPEFLMLANMQPLPFGFSQNFLVFKDESYGHGTLDISFHQNRPVNISIRLFLEIWLSSFRIGGIFQSQIVPLFQRLLGPSIQVNTDLAYFEKDEIIGVCRIIDGGSMSSALTEKKFA
jgi:hypothetical protein